MIGKHIQQLRIEKGLSLSEMAERAGVAKSYLSTIERDLNANPSINFLEKVSAVLDVDVYMLLDREDHFQHEWIKLTREAIDSGISRQDFKEFIEFNKWRNKKKEEK